MTTHTPEPGCYFDSHRGHYIVRDIITLAEGYGRKLDTRMADLVKRYDADSHAPDYPNELVHEESDAAIDWLNDHVPVDDHVWEWNDGDFGLYALDEED